MTVNTCGSSVFEAVLQPAPSHTTSANEKVASKRKIVENFFSLLDHTTLIAWDLLSDADRFLLKIQPILGEDAPTQFPFCFDARP